jgi:hypothetical protein
VTRKSRGNRPLSAGDVRRAYQEELGPGQRSALLSWLAFAGTFAGLRAATVELGLSVVFDISALVAGIRGGRLVAVHSGRCDATATLAIQDTKVISMQVHLELPGIIPLGRGIRLLADHGHPGDEAPQASVA